MSNNNMMLPAMIRIDTTALIAGVTGKRVLIADRAQRDNREVLNFTETAITGRPDTVRRGMALRCGGCKARRRSVGKGTSIVRHGP